MLNTKNFTHNADDTAKHNKRGFTMIELVAAIFIIALLTAAGIAAVSILITNARITATQQDLSGFRTPIEQFLLENPAMAKETDVIKIANKMNSYLEGEMQFANLPSTQATPNDSDVDYNQILDTPSWQTQRQDAWDHPYRIFINPSDMDATGNSYTGAKDSELRIFVVSNGKNSTTGTNGESKGNHLVDGDDDMILMVQLVNGQVQSGFYGCKEGNIEMSSNKATVNTTGTILGTSSESAKYSSNKVTDGCEAGTYAESGKRDKGSILNLYDVVLTSTVTNSNT